MSNESSQCRVNLIIHDHIIHCLYLHKIYDDLKWLQPARSLDLLLPMLYRSAQLHAVYTETSKSLPAPPETDKTIIGSIWILLEAKGWWPWSNKIPRSKFEFTFVLAGAPWKHWSTGCDNWRTSKSQISAAIWVVRPYRETRREFMMLQTHFFMPIPPTPGTLKRACIQWDNASLPLHQI